MHSFKQPTNPPPKMTDKSKRWLVKTLGYKNLNVYENFLCKMKKTKTIRDKSGLRHTFEKVAPLSLLNVS